MADKKISELNAATTLDGTELLPLVQSGETKKVAVSSLSGLGISAIAETLHRSPNAITSMFVYDTSKDSDGGLWVDRCQHTSWYNETIYGKWLGAQASEAAARAVSGAATDDYYQSTTDGKFYKLNTTSGVTEVFRGNKRSFPKVAGIVAEAASVTIYDLTEPGRPMFLRFAGVYPDSLVRWNNGSQSGCFALNGLLFMAANDNGGGSYADFAKDRIGCLWSSTTYYWTKRTSVADRGNTGGTLGYAYSNGFAINLANSKTNAVAMTVLPDAPVDPVTGLKVPTIAVATGGGMSVIQHSGTVRNSSSTLAFTQVTLTEKLLSAGRADAVWYTAANPGSLGASFTLSTKAASTATDFNVGNTSLLKAKNRGSYARSSGTLVNLLRNNEGTIGKGIAAKLSDTYNTGHLVGDIRRAYLADVGAGDVTSPELLTGAPLKSGNNLVTADGDYYKIEYVDNSYGAGWAYVSSSIKAVEINISAYSAAGSSLTLRASFGGNSIDTTISSTSPTSKTYFFYTTTNVQITLLNFSAGEVGWMKASIKEVTADRSYKSAYSSIYGTLTKTAVNTNTDLVAYSGFSAANYLREPYSADLDFGTGEWSCSAWVNTTQPAVGGNLLAYSEEFDNAYWAKSILGTGVTPVVTANAGTDPLGGSTADRVEFSRAGTATTDRSLISRASVSVAPGANYCFSFWAKSNTGSDQQITLACNWGTTGSVITITLTPSWQRFSSFAPTVAATTATAQFGLGFLVGSATSADILVWGAQMEPGSAPTSYRPTTAAAITPVGALAHRSFSSGPEIKLQMTNAGTLQAVAYDGTTTRTVTTSAAYNTATWLKAEAEYTTDGALAIRVNGTKVATTTGTALLTLNNSNAVLTIGNSYALDAPFPGSLALLKLSATVPTNEQAAFTYEQEKQLFREGAKCVLPASTSVLDLAYDDATDTWSALQASYESTWSGLVRTSTQAPSAGSFSKSAAGSGIKLLGRTTTNPGVDVQIPAKNLRTKDMPPDANQDIVVFDFDAVTSQTDFALPVGYTARVVYSAGAQKREGSTKDWQRKFDGFLETVSFNVAPGAGAWVQIHAAREVSL